MNWQISAIDLESLNNFKYYSIVFIEILTNLFSYLLLIVIVLISVAFMVLLERKVLGYIQIRKGPNKVGLVGVIQSIGDAVKLFVKEQTVPWHSNILPYYFSPVISLFLILVLWAAIPLLSNFINFYLAGVFFFCCTGFGVYTLMARGWSSNSNYALLGALRGVAQTISYEVRLALLFLSYVFLINGYKLIDSSFYQLNIWFVFFMFPLFIRWVASCLAESNRTPFDFAEGESELVSGFNIEYGRGGFAFLFLAEYGSIIFLSFLIRVMFLGGSLRVLVFIGVGCFFCFWFIWVRGTLPRFRYDKLIGLAWKSFLPISLNYLLFFIIVKLW